MLVEVTRLMREPGPEVVCRLRVIDFLRANGTQPWWTPAAAALWAARWPQVYVAVALECPLRRLSYLDLANSSHEKCV
jgi:hypothetical protein